MAVFDVRSDLVQDEGDDVGLHSQKQNVASVDRFFVARGQIHPHFLKEKQETWDFKKKLQ